jgi:hypothetical protein
LQNYARGRTPSNSASDRAATFRLSKEIFMKKTLIVIAAATLLPLAAVAGEGKDHSGSMGPSFDTLDANRDGRISQAEAASDTTITFASADANGDGYLDKKEFKASQKSGSSSQPQPQSMPQSTSPESSSPDSSTTDQTVPEPSASEPKPDTETPRQ